MKRKARGYKGSQGRGREENKLRQVRRRTEGTGNKRKKAEERCSWMETVKKHLVTTSGEKSINQSIKSLLMNYLIYSMACYLKVCQCFTVCTVSYIIPTVKVV